MLDPMVAVGVKMRSAWVLVLWLGAMAAGAAADMLEAVNTLREQAGLPSVAASAALAAAAARHASYLDANHGPMSSPSGVSAHRQQPGSPGFSGELPGDRAIASGYPHHSVLENVSMGYNDLDAAMDGLTSAIYHRLTFLDFAADEFGAARGERSRVFLLGRSDLRAVCEQPPQQAFIKTPVDCLGQAMTRDGYLELCASLPTEALYRPSHPISCANGQPLDADFMATVCSAPPAAARFRGVGRYYLPCGDGTRLDANWFDALCARPPRLAKAQGSGKYVDICTPAQRVDAEWLANYCSTLPVAQRYTDSGTYRRPCADAFDLRTEFLDALDHARLADRPAIVTWPPGGAEDVAPAFFIEEPDPLPDLDVAGNPVSLQVNPAAYDRVELAAFNLYPSGGSDAEPIAVRLLDAQSDPHALLTTHEFALFPLQRLDWGRRYEAEARLVLDGEAHRVAWSFTTRVAPYPIFTAAEDRQHFRVRSGEPIWLYLPPRPGEPHTVLRSRMTYPRNSQVDLAVIDPNTAQITVEAKRCDRVIVDFEPRRRVELSLAGCGGE